MRFFFRSPRFKLILGVTAGLIILAAAVKLISGIAPPQSSVAGAIAVPFQKFATGISHSIADFKTALFDGQKLMEENARLESEVARLTSDLVDQQKTAEENEFYKNYLGLKEQNPDFEMEPAMLISRDSSDRFGSFTIDKGSLNGIAAHDPVVTADGLVGYISEVAPTYSKVTTILSPDLQAGAFDRRTRDAGIVSGTLALAENGQCRLFNLPRSCSVTIGDYVVTSGGGIFPDGLLIGTVSDVKQEPHDISVYAVIDPAAQLSELRDMMVITYFSGQGALASSAGK